MSHNSRLYSNIILKNNVNVNFIAVSVRNPLHDWTLLILDNLIGKNVGGYLFKWAAKKSISQKYQNYGYQNYYCEVIIGLLPDWLKLYDVKKVVNDTYAK